MYVCVCVCVLTAERKEREREREREMAGFWRPGTAAPGAVERGRLLDREVDTGSGVLLGVNAASTSQQRRQRGDMSLSRLPIHACRRELLYLIERHSVVVLVGETGCGKSTQLIQMLHEAGWTGGASAPDKCVVCTQPRRLAVQSLAARVAEEQRCEIGGLVGYAVRFDNNSSDGNGKAGGDGDTNRDEGQRGDARERPATTHSPTRIKFVTDGVFIREMMQDPLLSRYSVVIVDEAHERSISSDLLLGLLKKLLAKRRQDLRIVIATATGDARQFADFFRRGRRRKRVGAQNEGTSSSNANTMEPAAEDDAPAIVSVQGRAFPVSTYYLQSPCPDVIRSVVETVMEIHRKQPRGDILVFLPGESEIHDVCRILREHNDNDEDNNDDGDRNPRHGGTKRARHARETSFSRHKGSGSGSDSGNALRLTVLPLYAQLPWAQQVLALQPGARGERKVIVASNVAETSVTLEGVVYVVDSCFTRTTVYDARTCLSSLVTTPSARSSCVQRAGRAGRTRLGACYRLCTEADYCSRLMAQPVPEMMRSDLTATVLQLKALGIDNIIAFDWIDPPPEENLIRALEMLYALGAIDEDGQLTRPVGMQLAELPVEPQMGKALLVAAAMGCAEDVATIAACTSVENLWHRDSRNVRVEEFEERRALFAVGEGDLITYLNVFAAYEARENPLNYDWFTDLSLSRRALGRVEEVRNQILGYMRRGLGLPIRSKLPDVMPAARAITSGFFANAAFSSAGKTGGNGYIHVRHKHDTHADILHVHPSSVLCGRSQLPPWIVFVSSMQTDRKYVRDILAIDFEWLGEVGGQFYEFV